MSEQARIIETFTRLAPRYEQVVDAELRLFWGWTYQGFLEKLFELTPILPEDHVLDLATGTGAIPRFLLRQGSTGNRIHALDITLSMLRQARSRLAMEGPTRADLVCASAMQMPYQDGSFTLVLCGLATHHMQAGDLLAEMRRVTAERGRIAILDVGGSPLWRQAIFQGLVRLGAYFYFLFKEGPARARAEAGAIPNIHSADRWEELLSAAGFHEITITRLPSRYSWIPEPLMMSATRAG